MSGLLLISFTVPAFAGGVASANTTFDPNCEGIAGCAQGGVNSTGNETPGSATDSVSALAKTVINLFSWVVGIVSVIMVIVGGFQYITSGGDSGKVTTAKNTIMYALIGIVIVALSQVMVQFVLERFVDQV
jgi:hypothetical protein